MRIAADAPLPVTPEPPLLESRLPLDGAHIVELGCGKAALTRAIACAGRDRRVLALEVDEIQHAANLGIADLPNVRFERGGAEAIPAPDASADVVLMFKSLHHVPIAAMPRALAEIRRVLKPGGFAWLSEPVFAGAFNDVVRVFHDERRVREAAFEAVRAAVEGGVLECVEQLFFAAPVAFRDFAEFERGVIGVTHTRHVLSPEQYADVRERFGRHVTADGARFEQPMRVDLLRRPVG
jgi:ubiquinone/menaquinone biosynthesis C-methylase UbiE